MTIAVQAVNKGQGMRVRQHKPPGPKPPKKDHIIASEINDMIEGDEFDQMTPAEASRAIREIWGSPFASYILTREGFSW